MSLVDWMIQRKESYVSLILSDAWINVICYLRAPLIKDRSSNLGMVLPQDWVMWDFLGKDSICLIVQEV
jgi:hypothetical protein